jgi:hypothetical protein
MGYSRLFDVIFAVLCHSVLSLLDYSADIPRNYRVFILVCVNFSFGRVFNPKMYFLL